MRNWDDSLAGGQMMRWDDHSNNQPFGVRLLTKSRTNSLLARSRNVTQKLLQGNANPQAGVGLTASFRQKSTGLSLVIVGSATAYYVANMWPMRPIALANDAIPAGYGGLVLGTVILIILAQIVLQAVLAIGAGSTPAPTAHERNAAMKANRNAYPVLVTGLLAAVGSVFLQELPPFCTANIAILSFMAAEMVRLGSQLVYARR